MVHTRNKREVKLVKLVLGKKYRAGWGYTPWVVQLIKPTRKGYNLLRLNTHKCVLKPHLYPVKEKYLGFKPNGELWFFVNKNFFINEIRDDCD